MTGLVYPPEPAEILPLPTYDNPQGAASFGGAIVPVVNENGIVTARAPRDYVHGEAKLLHPVVHLHVVNSKGEIYLQKRSAIKEIFPLYWDTAVGGHIEYGESVLEALYREAREEIGLRDFNPVFLTEYVFQSQVDNELVFSYACVGDFQPDPDQIEVSEGRYWTEREIDESFGKSILTPNFEKEFSMIRKALQTLL